MSIGIGMIGIGVMGAGMLGYSNTRLPEPISRGFLTPTRLGRSCCLRSGRLFGSFNR
jgi:hypothetical protein